MLEILQSKVEAIVENHANLNAIRLESALRETDVDSSAMTEINDRTLTSRQRCKCSKQQLDLFPFTQVRRGIKDFPIQIVPF